MQGETTVSNEIRGYRAQNFLSVGSSEWGMVVPASIARVLPRPTFSANCKAGMATLSAIHFASTILARSKYYIPYQSQTGACCLGFVQPTTEGRTWDVFSYLRWAHKYVYMQVELFTCGILGYYKDTTICKLVGIRWKYKVIFIWGCKCLRFV